MSCKSMKPFAVLLSALFLVSSTTWAQRVIEGPLQVSPIRDSLHLFEMEPAGNVVVSAGPDGAFIIDDQFAPMAPQIVEAVSELTDQPIRYILNTHFHDDHAGANAALGSDGYTIVAHDNARSRMSSDQWHLFFKDITPATATAGLPVITFSDSMSFYFNNDVVRVVHIPKAHTDGDAIFYFEKADLLVTGDAFINRGFPLIDVAGGGSIKGQIEATNRMLDFVSEETIVVPGHGPLADRARMIEIRDMLVTARGAVVELIEQGMTLDEIKTAQPLADLEVEWGTGFVRAKAFATIIYWSETGDWELPEAYR